MHTVASVSQARSYMFLFIHHDKFQPHALVFGWNTAEFSATAYTGWILLNGSAIRQRVSNRLKIRTLANARAHTYTQAPSTLPLLGAPAEGFCWNLPEFGRCIPVDVLQGCETYPLEAQFQSREQPEITGSEIRRVRRLGDVWHGAETTVPDCHLSRRFLCRTCQ
jgi:hypothetical protein